MTYGPHKLGGSGLTPGIGEGMPKGILGIHADNNTPISAFTSKLVGALTLGVTCQLKSCGMLNRW